jgi:hypothetical protein
MDITFDIHVTPPRHDGHGDHGDGKTGQATIHRNKASISTDLLRLA